MTTEKLQFDVCGKRQQVFAPTWLCCLPKGHAGSHRYALEVLDED